MTDLQHEQLQFSRQYWEALDQSDYDWADFIASCLEVRGMIRLDKSECGL